MENKILIGSHVSMGSPEFYLGSVKEALSYGATTLMLYTGAPQNTVRTPIEQLKIKEALELASNSGLDVNKFICHAPYLINLCNPDHEKREVARKLLKSEMYRTEAMGIKILVLHPGSHLKMGTESGLEHLCDEFNILANEIYDDHLQVNIALETMAGKGSEVGVELEQLQYVLTHNKLMNQMGVCLDTCHMNDAGYDLHDYENWKNKIKNTIGLDKVLAIHINDSRNPLGAHKDRHENIGYGSVGFDVINTIVHDPDFINVPKVLETPYVNGLPPYKYEIAMLKAGKFEEGWREKYFPVTKEEE